MAEKRHGGAGTEYTAVPVAHGGIECGTAKGASSGGRAQHEISGSKLSPKAVLFW